MSESAQTCTVQVPISRATRFASPYEAEKHQKRRMFLSRFKVKINSHVLKRKRHK
jgi:hypothetical protein